jgi:hypothetical protein
MSANTAQPDTPYGYTPEGKNTGVVKSKGKPTLHLSDGSEGVPLRARKPEWLKVRAPGGPNYLRLQKMMREQRLHTVCEEAHCPNIGECWESGTATFIILGDVCTRACKYCAVAHGLPTELDLDEPRRVADSVEVMGLEHAVITSVNRDELKDGGAGVFARRSARSTLASRAARWKFSRRTSAATRMPCAPWWRRSRRSSRTMSTPWSG